MLGVGISRRLSGFAMCIPLPRLRLLPAELHAYARYAALHNFVGLLLKEWLHCVALGTFEQPDHSPSWLVNHGVCFGRKLQLGHLACLMRGNENARLRTVFDPERKQLCERQQARCARVGPVWVAKHDNVVSTGFPANHLGARS